MARTIRNSSLESRTSRLKLDPRGKPYWMSSAKQGIHLGYRRLKNKNGVWVSRRYNGGDDYTTETFAEADDYCEAKKPDVLDYYGAMERLGDVAPRRRGGAQAYTVGDAVRDYIEHLQLHGNTAKESAGTLKHYLIGYLALDGSDGVSRVLGDLVADDFSGWQKWALRARPQGKRKKSSPNTTADVSEDELAEVMRARKERVNRVLNNVLACLNHAFENNKVTNNSAWAKLKRFKGTGQPRVRWLEMDECRGLTDSCVADFRRIVRGGLLTGARWSELRRIRVKDYDGSAGTVLIARSKRKKARHIYVTDEGRTAFGEWTAGRDRDAFVFTKDNGEQWGSHDQHRPMADARTAAGLGDDVTFHVLRHTYASMLVKAGVHLMIVAMSLGHADTRMVEKHYGHLAPSHAAQAIRDNLPTFGIVTAPKP